LALKALVIYFLCVSQTPVNGHQSFVVRCKGALASRDAYIASLGTPVFWSSESILPVLTGQRVHNEKSPSARRLAFSLGNQNFQFAKGRETLGATPLKFRTQ
jgi:hypothetical protein